MSKNAGFGCRIVNFTTFFLDNSGITIFKYYSYIFDEKDKVYMLKRNKV